MKYILSVLLILFYVTAAAQNRTLDSLNALLIKTNSDTARINLLNKISNNLINVNLDSANHLSRSTILIAKSKRYMKGEIEAHRMLAAGLCFKSDFAGAREQLEIAGLLMKTISDSSLVAKLNGTYGLYHALQSKYDSSNLYYKKSLLYAEHLADQSTANSDYLNIAINYQMQSDFSQALAYQKKALYIADKTHDYESMAYIFLNISIIYGSLNDNQRMEEYLLKAVSNAQRTGLINVEQYSYANLAAVYEMKKDFPKSYDYGMKAYELGKTTGNQGISSSSLSRAAVALAHQKKFPKAESLSDKAVLMADSSGEPLNKFQTLSDKAYIKQEQNLYTVAVSFYEQAFAKMKDADIYSDEISIKYNNLSECYEKTGNYAKALATYKMSVKIMDSLMNRNNIRKATELSMNYEFSQKQQAQRTEKEKEDRENTIRLIFLIAFLLVFITLSTVALFAYRREQKAKAVSNEKKKEAEQTLAELKTTQAQLIQSEKMASLGELTAGIAHEIQNPLNFVNNFSELNAEMIAELKEALDKGNYIEAKEIAGDIEANEEKITHHGKRADDIVKSMLQHSRKSTGAKEPADINALCDEYIRLSYHGLRAKDKLFNAGFTTQFDDSLGSVNLAAQDIGRVLLNIFNNAFYAVNERKKLSAASYQPSVRVETRKENDNAVIVIEDNGNGIPQSVIDKIFQPFFTTKPTGSGTGLGLSLSYDIITKEHNGTVKAESREGEGSRFIITLPISLS